MCGIAGGFCPNVSVGLDAIAHRGPDARAEVHLGALALGHVRLSILDLDARSNQPFQYGSLTLIYNGELWNYRTLRAELERAGDSFRTTGDTEVMAAALSRWGVDALPKLEGMFAAAWTTDGEVVYLARDRFGEIPLYLSRQTPFRFASERKALLALGAHPASIEALAPGTYAAATREGLRTCTYYDAPTEAVDLDLSEASSALRGLVGAGVEERAIGDVPVCTMLSGGIDSAAIALGCRKVLGSVTAYTAVYDEKSADLKQARIVAQALKIDLVEVKVEPPTLEGVEDIVRMIEMPSKAQVEIGWACLALAKAMRSDGFKVCFSGEGSDELWASYGFAYHALKTQDWHQYRKGLILAQAEKNFARCNKIFMTQGIECRLPFLHRPLVEFALSLPRSAVQAGTRPKAVMQDAFRGLLPDSVTKRQKVAFQDGAGIKDAFAKTFASPERLFRAEYHRMYA